jgi:2-hydroxychromene-2-carboxylate isomerase
LGQPAADILARAESSPFRPRLRENTQRATDLGIFGSRNCIVNGELFWGEEALEDAIDWFKTPSL